MDPFAKRDKIGRTPPGESFCSYSRYPLEETFDGNYSLYDESGVRRNSAGEHLKSFMLTFDERPISNHTGFPLARSSILEPRPSVTAVRVGVSSFREKENISVIKWRPSPSLQDDLLTIKRVKSDNPVDDSSLSSSIHSTVSGLTVTRRLRSRRRQAPGVSDVSVQQEEAPVTQIRVHRKPRTARKAPLSSSPEAAAQTPPTIVPKKRVYKNIPSETVTIGERFEDSTCAISDVREKIKRPRCVGNMSNRRELRIALSRRTNKTMINDVQRSNVSSGSEAPEVVTPVTVVRRPRKTRTDASQLSNMSSTPSSLRLRRKLNPNTSATESMISVASNSSTNNRTISRTRNRRRQLTDRVDVVEISSNITTDSITTRLRSRSMRSVK